MMDQSSHKIKANIIYRSGSTHMTANGPKLSNQRLVAIFRNPYIPRPKFIEWEVSDMWLSVYNKFYPGDWCYISVSEQFSTSDSEKIIIDEVEQVDGLTIRISGRCC